MSREEMRGEKKKIKSPTGHPKRGVLSLLYSVSKN